MNPNALYMQLNYWIAIRIWGAQKSIANYQVLLVNLLSNKRKSQQSVDN